MRCPGCGKDYPGIIHECSVDPLSLEREPTAPPLGAGLGYYLAEAFSIARWDDAAVERAARDSKALWYGLLFWSVALLLTVAREFATLMFSGRRFSAVAMIAAVIVILPLSALATLAYYGICHLLAQRLFDGTGTYMALLRPMMLGSVVQLIAVVPILGDFVARLWALGVFMYVLSEVDGIGRMQAFAISFGLGIIFFVLAFSFAPGLLFR